MAINFYFDEIFHDSKISIEQNCVNIFLRDVNDMYVGVFWGDKAERYLANKKLLDEFEIKYKTKLTIEGELKSKSFSKKNYKYGIKSFNRNTFDFYNELFELLLNINPIIQVTAISKCELLLRNIFDSRKIRLMGFKDDVFFYSLSKFILTYYNKEFDKAFYEAVKGNFVYFKEFLINTITIVLERGRGIIRKKNECPMLEQLLFLVEHYEFNLYPNDKIGFIYFSVVEGLMNLLDEKRIDIRKVNLFIDDCKPISEYARSKRFKMVTDVDSKLSIENRLSDWLCGFYGRMMRALFDDEEFVESYETINDIKSFEFEKKHIISNNWFAINEKQFDLYKKVYLVLVERQEAYWACMTASFGDQVNMFYSLLRYFGKFDSFGEYSTIAADMHREYFNTNCCRDLQYHFENEFGDTHREW